MLANPSDFSFWVLLGYALLLIAAGLTLWSMLQYLRGEVFGSGGMLTMGSIARSDKVGYLGDGIQIETRRLDTELLRDAYIAELNHFVDCVRTGSKPLASGEDARAALAIARACIESVQQAGPVRL